MSGATNPQTTLDVQNKMPQAESCAAALDAAIKAHVFHFSKDHKYVVTQDTSDVDMITSTFSNMEPPLTYTVKFELTGLKPAESEAHLIAIGLAEPPTFLPPVTTSITFHYWLDEDFSIKDKSAPVQCTDHHCPLGYFFHYKGLFVDDGGSCMDAEEYFGNTCPPARIWDAEKRIKLLKGASDMDRKLVKAFAQYHYWYYGQEYEGSVRALIESPP